LETPAPIAAGCDYNLAFEFQGTGTKVHEDTAIAADETLTETLSVGVWLITATASKGGTVIGEGSASVTIAAGATTAASIPIKPKTDASLPDGSLSWSITVIPEQVTGTLSIRETSNETPVTTSGELVYESALAQTGTLSLAPGSYEATVTLSRFGGVVGGQTESFYIFASLDTLLDHTYETVGDIKVTDFNITTVQVPAPVKRAAPQLAAFTAASGQWTSGDIYWYAADDADNASVIAGEFAPDTAYKAVVSLTAASGYTFIDVANGAFTYGYGGSGVVTNFANPGSLTITFPPTEADTQVNILSVTTTQVPAPVLNATPQTAAFSNAQWSTEPIAWKNADGSDFTAGNFAASKVYKAVIDLSAVTDWTFVGLATDAFSHAGTGAVVFASSGLTGELTITFPATADVPPHLASLTVSGGTVGYLTPSTFSADTLNYTYNAYSANAVTFTVTAAAVSGAGIDASFTSPKTVSSIAAGGSSVVTIPVQGSAASQNYTVTLVNKPHKLTGGAVEINEVDGVWGEVHTFKYGDTASGGVISNNQTTFSLVSNYAITAEVLAVAGGGGGGGAGTAVYSLAETGKGGRVRPGTGGGGGGAGGFYYNGSYALTAKTYTILVGDGGAGGPNGGTYDASQGSNGYATTFDGKTLAGGGGGAFYTANSIGDGSQGGSSGGSTTVTVVAPANAAYGNAGGASYGGGGGAGGAGGAGTSASSGGTGGKGIEKSLIGVSVTYARGGNGCANTDTMGTIGAGEAYTGSGGQGNFDGSAGGSGVVVVRVPITE
jgi:hypothetical protein